MGQLKKWLVFGFVFFLALVMVACGGQSSSTPAPSDSDTEKPDSNESEAPAEAKVINIGYSGPLSGPAAFYGENTLSGTKMAVDEINEAGGFEVDGQKYVLNLVTLDDKYLPNETGTNARRLVQENGAPIVFIPHSGGIFAAQVFNEMDEFIIAAYTSEPTVTEQGNELTVRIPPRYDSYMEPFSKYQMERFGKKIAFLPTATQYGKDWASTLKPAWEGLGGEIVYEGQIDFSKDTDFFTIVTNALSEDPDVLFIGGPSEPTALIVKQARELGFEGGFLIMDQAKLDEMALVLGGTEKLEGSVGVLPLSNSDYPGTASFIEKYKELYNKTPGSEAGFNYVATYIFVEAMKNAGTVDDVAAIRENMQAALESLPDEHKVYDIPQIGEDGGFESELRMAVVEEGEIKEVVPE